MPRTPPVALIVDTTEMLGPRSRRIRFVGRPAVESARPASYLSVWFSDPDTPRHTAGRSDKRTMTPRLLDRDAGTLAIDFVLHATAGPASTWASEAAPGTTAWAGPIVGGYDVPPEGAHLVLVGDDTAIPAIGTILEAIGDTVRTTVVIEVVDGADEREVSHERPSCPIWVHRGDDPAQVGVLTLNLLESLSVPDRAYWWIAGEREAIRAMRDLVVAEYGVTKDRLSLNAYWRLLAVDPRAR